MGASVWACAGCGSVKFCRYILIALCSAALDSQTVGSTQLTSTGYEAPCTQECSVAQESFLSVSLRISMTVRALACAQEYQAIQREHELERVSVSVVALYSFVDIYLLHYVVQH